MNQKEEEEKVPHKERSHMFVLDCAQNTQVPNFGQEQPGETCHCSPVNCHQFEIVDCALEKLHAHCHLEGSAIFERKRDNGKQGRTCQRNWLCGGQLQWTKQDQDGALFDASFGTNECLQESQSNFSGERTHQK